MPGTSDRTLVRGLERVAVGLSLAHLALALFHLVALDVAAISCATSRGDPHQAALLALFAGLLVLLPPPAPRPLAREMCCRAGAFGRKIP